MTKKYVVNSTDLTSPDGFVKAVRSISGGGTDVVDSTTAGEIDWDKLNTDREGGNL